MMIQVQYTDGRHDMVKAHILERLLDSHRLARFRRSAGWVVVGKDPVRRKTSALLTPRPGDRRRVQA